MALKQDTEEAQRSKDSEASHWDGSSNGTACCCCCCSSTCGASPPTPPTNSSSKCHGTVSSNAMADIRLGRGRGVLCSWLNAWRLGRWRGGDHCACARNNEMRMYVRHALVVVRCGVGPTNSTATSTQTVDRVHHYLCISGGAYEDLLWQKSKICEPPFMDDI